MAPITPCKPSNTPTDQYLIITIRILAVVGFSYLIRLFYEVIARSLFPHRYPPQGRLESTTEGTIGIHANDTAPAPQVSLELDFDTVDGGDLGIRIPEPAYHPR